MIRVFRVTLPILLLACALPTRAQLGLFSSDQRIAFTPDWRGERFADGRPKVPDAVLERLKNTDAEEAWDVLQEANYPNQFEGHWKVINPGERMVGRVVTAVFMPLRPDVDSVIQSAGKKEGRIGDENSWIIDILQSGDMLVVDLFGKVKDGTIVGDNLSTAIFAHSHNGLIVDGAVRDVSGIQEIHGFQVYTRDFDPSALENVMLVGINVPIRIGQTKLRMPEK
jgi:4-hydroxy-4-methyl-2-oxoglutarate aldolase